MVVENLNVLWLFTILSVPLSWGGSRFKSPIYPEAEASLSSFKRNNISNTSTEGETMETPQVHVH